MGRGPSVEMVSVMKYEHFLERTLPSVYPSPSRLLCWAQYRMAGEQTLPRLVEMLQR